MAKTREQRNVEIQDRIRKRLKNSGHICTVGDLIDALKKFDRNMPVVNSHYVQLYIMDGDTDTSGDEEFGIERITDLETRIAIETSQVNIDTDR